MSQIRTRTVVLFAIAGLIFLTMLVAAAFWSLMGAQRLPDKTSEWAMGLMAVALSVAGFGAGYAVSRNMIRVRTATMSAVLEKKWRSGDFENSESANQDDETKSLWDNLNRFAQLYRNSVDAASRRADELAMLEMLVTTINRTLDLQEVLDTSLRAVLQAVNWDVGAIYMWDERIASLNMVSYRGLSEDTVRQNITYRLGEGFIGHSAQERQIVIKYSDEIEAPPGLAPAPGWPETQISVPLDVVAGQLLGTLVMGSVGRKLLSADDMSLLMTVAAQIALAIDKAQLYTSVSEHAAELEGLVAARTEQLSQAIDELWIALKQAREADRVKSLLLSTVSHELRTPLATIKGSTSLLIEHSPEIPPDQRLIHLRDIDEEADKLTELISNLLEMSRIEAGSLRIQSQTVDLAQVLKSNLSKAKLRLKEHPIASRIPRGMVTISGDARRMDQIMANLLDNAAKFSPPGSTITVVLRKNNKDVIVSVSDTGAGISEEHIAHIFEHFYQANMKSDSGRQGIGLGLAICKGLVDAHGGKIWVESKPGSGSTFSFRLPRLDSEAGVSGESYGKDYDTSR